MQYFIGNFFILILTSHVKTIVMQPNSNTREQGKSSHILEFDEPTSFNGVLRSCIAERNHGAVECFNRGALSTLQTWNDNECLDFGGVKLERSDAESRNFPNFQWNSNSFENVIRATSKILGSRNIKWDLGNVYPGLQMRVGPTLSAANGQIEFVIDERAKYYQNNRQFGSGKLLMGHFLLPFLLGFKLNLSTLLPLLFGALIILSTKAFLLTKVILFIAGMTGWNSLFNRYPSSSNYISNDYGPINYGHHNPNSHLSYGNHFTENLGTVLHNPVHSYHPYRAAAAAAAAAATGTENNFPIDQHITGDVISVYRNGENKESEDFDRNKKNIVWSRNTS